MRRAHDRPSGPQTGAQGAENTAGATSTGMTSGAGATGPATATGTRGMADQPGDQRYARGTEPTTAYRGAPAEYETTGSSGSGGSLAVLAGLLSFLAGLAIVVRPHFYRTITGYAYAWNGRPWGIILLILGALLFAAGVAALLGIKVARPVAVGLAVLTAISGFLWLVYYPVWGIVIVAASGFAIWGLHHDAERDRERL